MTFVYEWGFSLNERLDLDTNKIIQETISNLYCRKRTERAQKITLTTIPSMSARKGPFRLVTVNTSPERAKRLIGRLIEALSDDYDITHIENCQSTDISS